MATKSGKPLHADKNKQTHQRLLRICRIIHLGELTSQSCKVECSVTLFFARKNKKIVNGMEALHILNKVLNEWPFAHDSVIEFVSERDAFDRRLIS